MFPTNETFDNLKVDLHLHTTASDGNWRPESLVKNLLGAGIDAAPHETVQTISAAGGVPILAHPGAAFFDRDYQVLISFMTDAGIQGIECYHPENSREITRYCLEICKSNNLLVTGGSDCHGAFVAGRCLGHPDIRLSQLRLEGIRMLI